MKGRAVRPFGVSDQYRSELWLTIRLPGGRHSYVGDLRGFPVDMRLQRIQFAEAVWSDDAVPLKLNRWSLPRIIARSGAGERINGANPALACIAPRATSPNVQESLAFRIEAKK